MWTCRLKKVYRIHYLPVMPWWRNNDYKENMLVSEFNKISYLSFAVTSIQSFPILTTGQDFLHSCRHLLGLHLSVDTIAILVSFDCSSSCCFFLGPIFKHFTHSETDKNFLIHYIHPTSALSELVLLSLSRLNMRNYTK